MMSRNLEQFSSPVTPKRPFSNKIKYRKALESADGYIHWVDKYFSGYGFEILADCDKSHIKEIKILTSFLKVDLNLRKTFIDFSEEMKHDGIRCEMRVIKDKDLYHAIHDRWLISASVCFNLPSPDIVARGQYSEIKKTDYKPPFGNWWQSSIDVITNWNEIDRMRSSKVK